VGGSRWTRVADHLVDEQASMGDFVLAGGEVAALAVIERSPG
jgi:tRNA (guanine37-N1)-methyltransferase